MTGVFQITIVLLSTVSPLLSMAIYRLIHNSAIYNTVSLHLVLIASNLTTMMLSNVYAFVFFVCGLVAFGRGSGDDLADMKQMMGKLFEEIAGLRSEVQRIRGQCGEENAILRSEVERIRGHSYQIENKVEAMSIRLEHVQEGNSTFEQTI